MAEARPLREILSLASEAVDVDLLRPTAGNNCGSAFYALIVLRSGLTVGI